VVVAGVPGNVIRFAKAWGNESLRLGYCVTGSLVPLISSVVV
jgi:hypothetical protein